MKKFLLILTLLSLPAFIWVFWQFSEREETLSSTLKPFNQAGEETKKDLSRIPSLPVTEEENAFLMQDDHQTVSPLAMPRKRETISSLPKNH
jgi:hypothetical protein